MVQNRTPEEIKEELKNNPDRKCLKVRPGRSYGYIIWYNGSRWMSAMSVEGNVESIWGNFENFNESEAEYNPNTKSIEYGDGGLLKVKPRSGGDSGLIREIRDQKGRSELIDLDNTIVGRLYLDKK